MTDNSSPEISSSTVGNPRATTVLLYCPDLMFSSRVRTIARHAGVPIKAAQPGKPLPDGALLVASHSGGEWEQVIRDAAAAGIPVIAFGPHVDTDGRRRARAAGAMRVVANGNVDRALAPVFQQLAATGDVAGPALSSFPEVDEDHEQ